jgi:pyruvate formate lyase activating enzyme
VDVLPFHQLGHFKWERLGMDYQLRDAQPPPREKIQEIIARFSAAGLKVV